MGLLPLSQIAGAFAQLEKARLVAKLRHARERIRKTKGKCEGRKSRVERLSKKDEKAADKLKEQLAEAVAMAKRRRRANPKTGNRVSLVRLPKSWLPPACSTREAKNTTPMRSDALSKGDERRRGEVCARSLDVGGTNGRAAIRTFFPDGFFLFAKVDEFGSGDKRYC